MLLMLCGCRHPTAQSRLVQAPARQKQLFVVIDDAGLSVAEVRRFLRIPVPITIAVLPHQKQTKRVCSLIGQQSDKQIMLHQPMEAYSKAEDPGKGAIYDQTRPADVARILQRNLASVRGAKGINNHMGSRVTENSALMREVLRYCKAHDLYFLDSKTAYNSKVAQVALEEHMRVEERHVFLDIQHDREYIREMWSQAVAHAREQGYVIVIGHAWSAETAAAIRDSYQTLINQGYTFHLLSELYE